MKTILKWHTQCMFQSFAERDDGKKLAIHVALNQGSEGWLVVAIQTSIDLKKLSNASEVFDNAADDHAHQNVGVYETPSKAFEAAESYTDAWMKRFKAASFDQCGCGEISRPK